MCFYHHCLECCEAAGVPKDCSLAVCDYSAELSTVVMNTSLSHCVNYFESYLRCGTGNIRTTWSVESSNNVGGGGGGWGVGGGGSQMGHKVIHIETLIYP